MYQTKATMSIGETGFFGPVKPWKLARLQPGNNADLGNLEPLAGDFSGGRRLKKLIREGPIWMQRNMQPRQSARSGSHLQDAAAPLSQPAFPRSASAWSVCPWHSG